MIIFQLYLYTSVLKQWQDSSYIFKVFFAIIENGMNKKNEIFWLLDSFLTISQCP